MNEQYYNNSNVGGGGWAQKILIFLFVVGCGVAIYFFVVKEPKVATKKSEDEKKSEFDLDKAMKEAEAALKSGGNSGQQSGGGSGQGSTQQPATFNGDLPLTKGYKGDEVKALQTLLNWIAEKQKIQTKDKKGKDVLWQISTDGNYGAKTEELAKKAFPTQVLPNGGIVLTFRGACQVAYEQYGIRCGDYSSVKESPLDWLKNLVQGSSGGTSSGGTGNTNGGSTGNTNGSRNGGVSWNTGSFGTTTNW